MKQNIYSVIAYVPGVEGWHDRCGDYHSGQESELTTFYSKDIHSAGVFIGENQFNDTDTEFTILVNGLNEDQYHEFLSNDEQFDLEQVSQSIRDIAKIKFDELKAIKLAQEEAAQLKKLQDAEFISRREKERLEQAERAQLAQLQAKYGK